MVFGDPGLVTGVEKAMTLACQTQQSAHDNWAGGFIENDNGLWFESMPFVVYIPVDDVDRPAVDYADIINGDAALGASQAGGWAVRSLYETPKPVYLSDHVSDYTVTLLDGFDYTCDNGIQYLFHVDLSQLKLPIVPLSDGNGDIKAYYKLFGWTAGTGTMHDAVRAFHGDSLDPWSAAVWDMHQNGATKYNVKQLLAGITGSVVCEEDGAINKIWTEQGSTCMLIGDRVYTAAPGVPLGLDSEGNALAQGTSVSKGQILFGSLKMYSGRDMIPAAAVPGMYVRTDAGEFIARNSTETSTGNILPLECDSSLTPEEAAIKLQAYEDVCTANMANPDCPYVELSASVNPMMFLLQRFRRGRAIVISLVAKNLAAVSAAIKCIRRCTNATGMVNIYVQAESDTVSVSARFTADAGQAAVATVATVTVMDMFAEANTII